MSIFGKLLDRIAPEVIIDHVHENDDYVGRHRLENSGPNALSVGVIAQRLADERSRILREKLFSTITDTQKNSAA